MTAGGDGAGPSHVDAEPLAGRLLHGAARGVVGAMAMTGMRRVTSSAGIIRETPPEAIFRQRLRALLPALDRGERRVRIELAHWGYGAAGGAAFAGLPESVRARSWAGPVYGLAIWLSFELGIAPALGLSQAKRVRLQERLAFAADHLLYGIVVAGPRGKSGP